MSLSDTTDSNTLAEREFDGGGDFDANEEAKIREEALDLAGTYFAELSDKLIDKFVEDEIFQGHFKHQFKGYYESCLANHVIENIGEFKDLQVVFVAYCEGELSNKKESLLKSDIEAVAIEHFRDKATMMVRD